MTQISPDEWNVRLAQADKLTELGSECAMCGGTGGWPGIQGFALCKPCDGSGSMVPTGTAPN